jgi:SOS-response transcriptional repressor LexA
MVKKNEVVELPFYHYLQYFYSKNRGRIKNHYKGITKKFLDFNDPENADAFLRKPQFEALEMYIFLKEYLGNRHLYEIFQDWYRKEGVFQNREGVGEKGEILLFDDTDPEKFKSIFNNLKESSLFYPNFIYALTMGLGKTVLMATSIFYEFLLANKFPKDPNYCHNALVFAPDKTVLQSLKEIQTFDKSQVVPPEYIGWLDKHLQFHYLDDSGVSLNTIDRSMFNIIISNTQKIILKKQHSEKTAGQKFFDGMDSRYRAKSLIEGYEDLYDLDSEIDLKTNQRFSKLIRLEQLGIYVDEAHHVFGSKLEKDMSGRDATSLRLTINELAKNLEEAGTHVVACYNYTGTPYANNSLLPEVVYAYGLKDAINNRYLKQVTVNGYTNTKSREFVKLAIEEFWSIHKDKKYEGMLPKIALFAATIEELEKELKPAVEKVLLKLDIPISKILINVGDERLTSNDDLREFINLDTRESEKQFILLVNKGKEGWNCRSLFAVCLFRKPKSKIFVLQATMRCLRSITNNQQSGNVYLSDENLSILESELEENFRMTVDDMNRSGEKDSVSVQVRVLNPPILIPIKRVQHLYRMNKKEIPGRINLDIDKAPYDSYKVFRTQKDIKDLGKRTGKSEELEGVKENSEFSVMTLVAEIARYLNRGALEIEKILESTKEGLVLILKRVNEYNELLYNWIIPTLFRELYELEEFESKSDNTVSLVKEPPEGYYTVRAKKDLLASLKDKAYLKHKDRSFHVDNYCFDSNPELKFFNSLLGDSQNKSVYFTGMFTHGQSDFVIHYIDPDSHALRSYYPDFLTQLQDGTYAIHEVKADYMVDDRIVQAKADYAKKMAVASGMTYQIVKQSEITGESAEGAVQGNLFYIADYRGREYRDALPFYTIKAACGKFGEGQEVSPDGWVEVPPKPGMSEGWFVAQAIGKSMEPQIPDGSLCIFRPVSAGTKDGKIILIQHHDIDDPESGGKYTLKRYTRIVDIDNKGNERKKILLQPINNDYKPMVFENVDEDSESQFRVVGEFAGVLK